jgi:DNA helicase-2/ATP-dependent DNA helicase PcrA
MVSWQDFENAIQTGLGRKIEDNKQQSDIISAPADRGLFVVAGPGSGKTTVSVLRILKLIFVDGLNPSGILATTFTRKAAAELRSRILGWGSTLKSHLLQYEAYREQLESIDLNQVITGTLDSLAQEILGEHRSPGSGSPVVIEDFVASALMTRKGLLSSGRYNNEELNRYLSSLTGQNRLNIARMSELLLDMRARFYNDRINLDKLIASTTDPGFHVALETIQEYENELVARGVHDFVSLESLFLDEIVSGKLDSFLKGLQYVIVDEYQDTNALQECIYFALAKRAYSQGGSIMVVGDDDQSLYRFRGSTVDLFNNFPERLSRVTSIPVETVHLSGNYRSTRNIVKFCNEFINLDPSYVEARVKNKEKLRPKRDDSYINFPILGMFRDDVESLARDLSEFILNVLDGGVTVRVPDGNSLLIQVDKDHGSAADIAYLCSSPQELSSSGRPRLPLLLRESLLRRGVSVYNPRGQHLNRIECVQQLCGLLLECIDPERAVERSINRIPQDAKNMFSDWRSAAAEVIESNREQIGGLTLRTFVDHWKLRKPTKGRKFEGEYPLIDLVYKLVSWIKTMQDDVEGLVYLEAITRTMVQTTFFSSFGGNIVLSPSNPDMEVRSIREAYWSIFIPLALGVIDVNEELLETLPMDRINIMSIHQSKGLEFPLVIVDVGSDFKNNHHSQRFKRFPSDPGSTSMMEEAFREYSDCLDHVTRGALDREFDDLVRQYFVAFSRAQDVLLLVGLTTVKDGYSSGRTHKTIPNIATGWDRNAHWKWGLGLPNLIHI